MKKILSIITCIIIGVILFFFCYDYNKRNYPNEYYNVYLDGEFLGTIISQTELENYINEKSSHLINTKQVIKTYCSNNLSLNEILAQEEVKKLLDNSVDVNYYESNNRDCVDITIEDGQLIEQIYTPTGLKIEKVLTHNPKLNTIEEIYSKIAQLKSFTIKGYKFTISSEDLSFDIYTTDKKIFEDAVNELIATYVGKNDYKDYLEQKQEKIKTVGELIENVYIEEEIIVKETQIPIDKKIYTETNELAQYLLYGDTPQTKRYTVKQGEMISDIAFNNEINIQEFLIANPKYKNENSLIAVGSEVLIKQTSPQLSVVVEKYVVEDQENDYKTIYQYDSEKLIGYTEVTQKGVDGLERISQRQKIINGLVVYVEPKGKQTLKQSIDEVVIKGDKYIPNVGDLSNWGWPCESGWTMNSISGFEWRVHPITGERHFHNGLDIAGLGYNAPVLAANNGTVITKATAWDFGNYIVINHNNGYYTLYAHMNKFFEGINVGDTVIRGQQIGYVGSTGQSTGPHIHYEVWKGCPFCRINPWSLYR